MAPRLAALHLEMHLRGHRGHLPRKKGGEATDDVLEAMDVLDVELRSVRCGGTLIGWASGEEGRRLRRSPLLASAMAPTVDAYILLRQLRPLALEVEPGLQSVHHPLALAGAGEAVGHGQPARP